jgi:hypothetical protein
MCCPAAPTTAFRLQPFARATALLVLLLAATRSPAAIPVESHPASADAADPPAPAGLHMIRIEAARLGGPKLSASGSADYSATQQGILNLPQGRDSTLSDVLAQMPGVSIDQNQQIHIRDTEGPQFQYRIDGVMVPLDINTNPPFLSMINPMFVQRVDLLTGVLPAAYSYATGGVVDIETKDGCSAPPGGTLSILGGQRDTFQPSIEQSGCDGRLGYFTSALYTQSNTAFSSATPGPTPYHDAAQGGQMLSALSYRISEATRLRLILSAAANDNQLPNVPGLTTQYVLASTPIPASQSIDSELDFRDALAIAAIRSAPRDDLSWQLAYSFHTIVQAFRPDDVAELAYQGVASTATHRDLDHSLQGDLTWRRGGHALRTGFYAAAYSAHVEDSSLVFPVDATGTQISTTPLQIGNAVQRLNWLSGLYVDDLWRMSSRLTANAGLRWDRVTGFTRASQLDPTINITFRLSDRTTMHGGFSRDFQVPIFQGISPNAPAAFAGTTAAGPPGAVSPVTEDDSLWDFGLLTRINTRLTLSEDNYYEHTRHYLDTGQFGVVPIFAPFNYGKGYMWGSEVGARYQRASLSVYANVTLGRNWQEGVATGQFNFDSSELAFIDAHSILLDHQPLVGTTAGFNETWRGYSFGLDGIFSSGLRAGFADQEQLPPVLQFNISVQRSFEAPGIGAVTGRLSVLNVFDRINLIRPAEGIGIFQSAYGPRRTVYATLTVPL